MKKLCEFEKLIRYKFKNKNLLIRALTHSSFSKEIQNYEKLEFLGDRVLGLIISTTIFNNFHQDNEGQLAKKLSVLVCKNTLRKIAENIKITFFLRVSKEIKVSSINSIKANSLEAILAAIYLDSDFLTVSDIVNDLWRKEIANIDLLKHDPKSRLQEWCLKKNNILPEYKFVDKTGPEHEPEFTIEVKYNEKLHAIGKGKNKQYAEINAAKNLLKKIEKK